MHPPGSYPPFVERRALHFTGRVQGVGFRATARSIARRHALTGFARNNPDGSVTVHAQGPGQALQAFLTDLRHVMHANITSEASSNLDLDPAETDFVIRA